VNLQQSVLLALLLGTGLTQAATTNEPGGRGLQFLPFTAFTNFHHAAGSNAHLVVLTSPRLQARLRWDELILSWNARLSPTAGLHLEARAFHAERPTKWYTLGLWSAVGSGQPRTSVREQADEDGRVATDTLILARPTRDVQVRVTLDSGGGPEPELNFLGVSLLESAAPRESLPPDSSAWGHTLDVIERSQMSYENGGVLCSPTTVSMLLNYWGRQLIRPELEVDVPEVSPGVHDPGWGGTGNWAFNMAYAGSFRGLRAYVTRLSDVAELEAFIARGIPVGLSLCYNRLRGKGREPSGHLVVCVGFSGTGDVIVNDPGTTKNVRKTFPRANLIDAWAYSKNAVYLVYPENLPLPPDRFGHWESPTATAQIELAR
jgi:hypothetical protein